MGGGSSSSHCELFVVFVCLCVCMHVCLVWKKDQEGGTTCKCMDNISNESEGKRERGDKPVKG